jgi:hypothetical protein
MPLFRRRLVRAMRTSGRSATISIAGGEIRQIDGRQFVSLSNSRHRLLAAYEILGSSLRAAHDDDFAHIRDGRGRIQHQT